MKSTPEAGEGRAGTIRDPRVFADLESEAYATAVEEQVSDGHGAPLGQRMRIDDAHRPGLEPARLIMDAVAREMPFRHEAHQLPIRQERGAVEHSVLVQDGQPDRDHHAPRFRQHLHQCRPGTPEGVGRVEGVLASVPGQAELRQTQHRDAHGPRLRNGPADVFQIMAPVERGLVQHRRADMEGAHGRSSPPRAFVISRSLVS